MPMERYASSTVGKSTMSVHDYAAPLPAPPDSVSRLEIDIVMAAGGLSIALLMVQVLHWRPSPLLTHGGMAMLVGVRKFQLSCSNMWLALLSACSRSWAS